MSDICAVPGCGAVLYAGSKTTVCRNHMHAVGYCQCSGCLSGSKNNYRIKTREELQKEGLLP